MSPGAYGQYFSLFLPAQDVFFSITKVVVFAIVVTLIHCYYGFYASGGPAGVGIAVGRAIRTSIVAVVLLNLFMSVIMWPIGAADTVRIAG
jgi:phospholipid/cholesterol/gamma-HCH transport system permease protein